jgi:iron complex transport system permease protein
MSSKNISIKAGADYFSSYRQMVRRRSVLLILLLLAIGLSFLGDVITGPAALSARDLFVGLFNSSGLSRADSVILYQIRLPDALIALVVGAALGLSGVELQTVLNNPLASPYTLGLSSSAALGAAISIVFDIGIPGLPVWLNLPLFAFIGSLLAGLVILLMTAAFGGNINTAILFGIAIVFLSTALTAAIQYVATAEATQLIVFWTIGNLTRAGWVEVIVVGAVVLVILPLSLRDVWQLTLLKGGEEQAGSLGVPVARLRLKVILRTSLLAAAAVCFVGTISFVGLVGPHIARLLLGENHKFLIPGAALSGALLLSLASIMSKSVLIGTIIPVGIVTSLIGVPIFLLLVLTQKKAHL